MKKLFAKTLSVIIAVMLILSAMPIAFAADEIASGTAGEGVNWVLNADGTLTISGEGEIVVDWYAPPWKNYNNDIINIDVQEGITTIPSTAFCYAENLVSVNIPASVTNIPINDTPFFWGNFSLQAVNVHPENPAFVSVDGIVFSKDQTMLCIYPMNKAGDSYTVPETVTTINASAFAFNEVLQSVVLPDTVKTIYEDAFYNSEIKSVTLGSGITKIPRSCFSSSLLESLVIPDSVETIDSSAFWYCNLNTITIGTGLKTVVSSAFGGCENLTAVHYTGTEAQWGEIAIDENGNEYLLNASVHYITEENYKDGFDPDCETNGHTDGIYCEECEAFITGSVIYAPGHNFENGVCTECKEACEHQHYAFDGICDICGQDVPIPVINVGETKSVYIKEEHGTVIIMFTAPQSGYFALTSDRGDNDIDPYVTLYDIDGNEINYADDDDGRDFKLTFDAVAGESYFFELSSYDDDSSYTITLDEYYEFLLQPTAQRPFVVFSYDNAEYQWHTATLAPVPVTPDNAEILTYDWGQSSYSSENGWTGVLDSPEPYSICYDFFTISLKAGESVTVEILGDYSDGVGLWDYNQSGGVWCDLTDDSTYTLTAETAGNYTVYSFSESGNVNVKANALMFMFNKIKGQTSDTLKNPVIGTYYACEATANGHSVMSDVFEYTYFIKHQPTSAEPYVELNEGTKDAEYQWYKAEEVYGEITDEDVDPFTMNGGDPSYYDENGWTGNYNTDGNSADFFIIELEEGEEITVETYGNVSSVTLFSPEYGSLAQTEYPDENGIVTFTAPISMGHILSAECDADAKIKAYKQKIVFTAIEGQTTNILTDAIINTNYFCEITIGDKIIESDEFLCVYSIIHQPTKAEPFVGLNDDTDATYQWYSVAVEQAEITDQDDVLTDLGEMGVLASYDEQNGWSGLRADPEAIVYFVTPFNKGDKITFTANDDAAAVAILDVLASTEGELSVTEASFNQDGTATLTVPANSIYLIMVNSTTDTAIKVYRPKYTFTIVEGETDAELKTDEKGIYICEVTFADGSFEISDFLNTNYMFGDINDDGSINNKDLGLLMQYLNNWDVEVNKDAADVNCDNTVNNKDYGLLMQYLNNWDVTLG